MKTHKKMKFLIIVYLLYYVTSVKLKAIETDLDIHILPSQKYRLTPRDIMSIKAEVENELMHRVNEMEINYDSNPRLSFIKNTLPYQRSYPFQFPYVTQRLQQQPLILNHQIGSQQLKNPNQKNDIEINGEIHFDANVNEDMLIDLLAMKKNVEKKVNDLRHENETYKKKVISKIVVSNTTNEEGLPYLINTDTNEVATVKMKKRKPQREDEENSNEKQSIENTMPSITVSQNFIHFKEETRTDIEKKKIIEKIMLKLRISGPQQNLNFQKELPKMTITELKHILSLVEKNPNIIL